MKKSTDSRAWMIPRDHAQGHKNKWVIYNEQKLDYTKKI
jgi:hypothetical protein